MSRATLPLLICRIRDEREKEKGHTRRRQEEILFWLFAIIAAGLVEVDWAWMVVVRFLQQSQLELAFRALLLLLDAADLHLIGIFIIIVLVAAGDLFFFFLFFFSTILLFCKRLCTRNGEMIMGQLC